MPDRYHTQRAHKGRLKQTSLLNAARRACDEPGCTDDGQACYDPEMNPAGHYCREHRWSHRFCVVCGNALDKGERLYCAAEINRNAVDSEDDDEMWDPLRDDQ